MSEDQARDCRILACLMSFAAVVDEAKAAKTEEEQEIAAEKLGCQIEASMTDEVTAFAKSLGYDIELRMVTPGSTRKQ